jgi:hypothetical protein
MATAWIVLVVILLGLLWLGFREADREYMRCICGKQPVLEHEEHTGGKRYRCKNCGIISAEGRTRRDAEIIWHTLVRFHKSIKKKNSC